MAQLGTWIYPNSNEHKVLKAYAVVGDVDHPHMMELTGETQYYCHQAAWRKLNDTLRSHDFFGNYFRLFNKITRNGLYAADGLSVRGVWMLTLLNGGFAVDLETGNFSEDEFSFASIAAGVGFTRRKKKIIQQLMDFAETPARVFDLPDAPNAKLFNELLINKMIDVTVTRVERDFTVYEYKLNSLGFEFRKYVVAHFVQPTR